DIFIGFSSEASHSLNCVTSSISVSFNPSSLWNTIRAVNPSSVGNCLFNISSAISDGVSSLILPSELDSSYSFALRVNILRAITIIIHAANLSFATLVVLAYFTILLMIESIQIHLLLKCTTFPSVIVQYEQRMNCIFHHKENDFYYRILKMSS